MTYEEALSFWYGRINYEVRSARPADLKLERMRALLRRLGDPQERVRLVHVTGTKGKGSTCAMLASVLRVAGYRVGLFTSPHLTHVEERIQVDEVPISHAELVACMEEVAPAVRAMEAETHRPPPTFFEIGTALGFLHFVRRRCDIAIIEVGLGGRFDSTNVCRPLVSVITNVGFDHMTQLGHTLEEIAYQKAGIIKRRVPVVSGVIQDGPREVIRKVAEELGAPLWEVGVKRPTPPSSFPSRREGEETEVVASSGFSASVDSSSSPSLLGGGWGVGLRLNLLGAHQLQNAAVAIATLERLRETGLPISDSAVVRGLAEVKWPARIELISTRPAIILDTAHNVPSVEALVKTLRESFPVSGTKRVVFAVSADKQFEEILRILAGYFDHFHVTKYGNNPRCVPPEKLATTLKEVSPDKPFTLHVTSVEAWQAARFAASENDLVCVTGSVFLAGELRPILTAAAS
ncbi:MAG: bifunctional folylpolyglutamate synthase/dihydrofolate synthase [Planctomycetia bacterium]|nr:bifunctional folylpolyglutamate synthase/dihydrofolate synthase [Planctomycetia bacterium]